MQHILRSVNPCLYNKNQKQTINNNHTSDIGSSYAEKEIHTDNENDTDSVKSSSSKKSISSQLTEMLAGGQGDGGALSNLVVVDSKGNIVRMSSEQEKYMQRKVKGVQFKGFRRFANGGSVPGYGEQDTVPALLTPGEFVVNKKIFSFKSYP